MRGSRLKDQLSSYQEELRRRGVGAEYACNIAGIVRRFIRRLEAEQIGCVRRVTADHVLAFLEEHLRYSASYQRTTIGAVRGFLEYHKNPCMFGMKMRVYGSPPTKREFLSRERAELLLRTPMSWEEAFIFMMSRLEGLRGSEILRFTAGDARAALMSNDIPIRGKTGPDTVPLRPTVAAMLRAFLETHPRQDHELMLGFNRNRMEKILARLSKRMGFPVRLRDDRRGFGKDYHDEGEPLVDIAALMRHKDPAMTMHYLCLDSDAKQRTMEKVSYPERSGAPFILAK